ncbi:MAG: hypothetical protein ACKV2U_10215 [Bryobacteraceae bacterium]
MTTVVKNKTPIVIPPSIQRRAGITAGDRLEFRVSGGIISILPKRPAADEEYTPERRLQIGAELAEASKGPYFGPFDTADSAITFMNLEIQKRRSQKRPSAKK